MWIFSGKEEMKFIGEGPSLNIARTGAACGIFISKEHSGRPVIVVTGYYRTKSEYWDFTVVGSKWQLCSN